MNDIKYSVNVKKLNYFGDVECSGAFVKEFKIHGHKDGKVVGSITGNIFDMMGFLESGSLFAFDESAVTERFYTMMYHGTPLSLKKSDIIKGFRPEFLNMLNSSFGNKFELHSDPDFKRSTWYTHYNLKIGFVEDVFVDESLRGMGIGNSMMSTLRRFRNTVDFMILQSYPSEIESQLESLGLTHDEESAHRVTPGFQAEFDDAQKQVDGFYERMGFSCYREGEYHWMITDRKGLGKLIELPKEHLIKFKVKQDIDDGLYL